MKTSMIRNLVLAIATVFAGSLNGQTLYYGWSFTGGGSGSEEVKAVTTDAAGNVYAVGSFTGTVDFDPTSNVVNRTSTGWSDAFVAKYDETGSLLWVQSFGGAQNDDGSCVRVDADGYIYVGGKFTGSVDFDPSSGTAVLNEVPYYYSTYPNPVPAGDAYALKLDGNGNFIWVGQFGLPGYDYANDIAVDNSGNVIMVGKCGLDQNLDSVDVDPGSGQTWFYSGGGFVVKYNPSGVFTWAGQMGRGTSGFGPPWQWKYNVEIKGVQTDANGRIYIAGSFHKDVDFDFKSGSQIRVSYANSNSYWDGFTVKYNSNGNYLNVITVGGAGANCEFNGLALDASNRIHLAGSISGTVDIDPSSGVKTLTSAGNTDAVILKYNAAGTLIWGKLMGGTKPDVANALVVDASGDIYSTGSFQGKADFNPASGKYNLTSAGNDDIFISKLNQSGKFVWARQIGGISADRGLGIAISQDENTAVYTCGAFSDICDFDQEAGVDSRNSAGGIDLFLHKLDQTGTSAMTLSLDEQLSENSSLGVYPNPTNGIIRVSNVEPGSGIEILDLNGSVILKVEAIEINQEIDLTHFTPGIYLLRFTDESESQTIRLIRQ